jgi:hypothetical protein
VITSLTEPHPSQQMIQEDPWWRTGFSRPTTLNVAAYRALVSSIPAGQQ